ncbi:MAG: ThuA domain-containing protein [Thermoguttaceae bacterium]
MKRRDMLKLASTALGLSALPLHALLAAEPKPKRILYFTRSAGFEHSVVHRQDGQLAFSEKVLTEMGKKAGYQVECSQDGRLFDGSLDAYDAFAFYTSGDLISAKGNGTPMTVAGKQRLLDAVAAGKGFLGLHACTDSFRSTGAGTTLDPFLAMVGAEFVAHDAQQEATLRIASQFPGIAELGHQRCITLMEEWYAQRKFAKDLHVILVQETKGVKGAFFGTPPGDLAVAPVPEKPAMKGPHYQRPPFPATWARRHGQGRVFYTSLGHREDIWTNPVFQGITLAGLAWITGRVAFDAKSNLDQVTPGANQGA